jgi:hypothetical protein
MIVSREVGGRTSDALAVVTAVIVVLASLTGLSGFDRYGTVALTGVLAAMAFLVGNAVIDLYSTYGTTE